MNEAPRTAEQRMVRKDLVVTGELAAMVAARDTIMDFIREYCPTEQVEIDIMLALQEALANAIIHGCHSDPNKRIHCSIEIDASAITIVILDPGNGFDTAAAAESSEAGANLTEHGRGICLMRALMDDVSYDHSGAEVHLKKLRAAPTIRI